LFRSDCPGPAQGKVKQILMVDNVALEEKYLGLPTPEDQMKKDKFVTLKEKLVKRLTNWVK
jgi:hypothetical protein